MRHAISLVIGVMMLIGFAALLLSFALFISNYVDYFMSIKKGDDKDEKQIDE